MKIWLDDERPEPTGWVRVHWPQEAISLLKEHSIETISLDHDLGDDEIGTGYDVLLWIEEQVHTNENFILPEIRIHTANSSAGIKMRNAVSSIMKYYKE